MRKGQVVKRQMLAGVCALVATVATFRAAAAPAARPVDVAKKDPAKRLTPADFRLIGGWRLAQPFALGGLAIDFENKRIFMNGHAQRAEVMEFSLMRTNTETGKIEEVKMGTGDDVSRWPRLDPVKKHDRFWKGGYAGGLYCADNRLWVSPRTFYDMSPPPQFDLYGKNLGTGEVETMPVKLPRAAFGGGFVKGKPGAMLLGCGGYESGQGSVAGPTLATMDGRILIGQKSHGTMAFEQRELRPTNYWPKAHKNGWTALEPKDGVGRWACDRIHGGGIWHPRGVCYWALLGTGDIDYARQNETFGAATETWLYTYDPQTYDKVEFNIWKHGHVHGQEAGPDGRIYLLVRNVWQSAEYQTDSAIKVFEIANE